ncbi:Galactosyl transferase [Artemisia annua]|uniref:Galactosyl transferase n=1 Tax=Artemisia annua TaxID=35608 RepID=A0A2U1NDK6_ARTAN|nr:Galactosyl transferase [Artemisia annua]
MSATLALEAIDPIFALYEKDQPLYHGFRNTALLTLNDQIPRCNLLRIYHVVQNRVTGEMLPVNTHQLNGNNFDLQIFTDFLIVKNSLNRVNPINELVGLDSTFKHWNIYPHVSTTLGKIVPSIIVMILRLSINRFRVTINMEGIEFFIFIILTSWFIVVLSMSLHALETQLELLYKLFNSFTSMSRGSGSSCNWLTLRVDFFVLSGDGDTFRREANRRETAMFPWPFGLVGSDRPFIWAFHLVSFIWPFGLVLRTGLSSGPSIRCPSSEPFSLGPSDRPFIWAFHPFRRYKLTFEVLITELIRVSCAVWQLGRNHIWQPLFGYEPSLGHRAPFGSWLTCRVGYMGLRFCIIWLIWIRLSGYWAKLPLIRRLMFSHPEVEWIWWIDGDVLNFQWSLDLLDVWVPMGPKGPIREEAGKILTASLKGRPAFEADDQSTEWMNKEGLVDRYEEMMEKYHPGLGDERWPFVTHFVGYKPCGSYGEYPVQRCLSGMERAFNFVDNQVLKLYGFRHRGLLSLKINRIRNEFVTPLKNVDQFDIGHSSQVTTSN